jgi:hypothetical protein
VAALLFRLFARIQNHQKRFANHSFLSGSAIARDCRLTPRHNQIFCAKRALTSSRSDALNLAVRFNANGVKLRGW